MEPRIWHRSYDGGVPPDIEFEEIPLPRVHGGCPEFFRVHLAQSLITLDFHTTSTDFMQPLKEPWNIGDIQQELLF